MVSNLFIDTVTDYVSQHGLTVNFMTLSGWSNKTKGMSYRFVDGCCVDDDSHFSHNVLCTDTDNPTVIIYWGDEDDQGVPVNCCIKTNIDELRLLFDTTFHHGFGSEGIPCYVKD